MLLQVRNLNKSYHKDNGTVFAVKNINFSLEPASTTALLGISGSGKSTLARLLTGLSRADSGQILFNGSSVDFDNLKQRRDYYRQVQLIFQEPASSFYPGHTVGRAIAEPLLHCGCSYSQVQKLLPALLEQTGLSTAVADKYIYQLSGGEAQRAAIARAVSIRPRLLICDEITSSLDTLTQRQIISLLQQLQTQYQTALLFITHDIALAADFCQHLLLIADGSLVEAGTAADILRSPQHSYTRQLLKAAAHISHI